jgi:hypothetical protein
MTKALLIACGLLLMAAAGYIGFVSDPSVNRARLAILFCVGAAALFAATFPGNHGGRAA